MAPFTTSYRVNRGIPVSKIVGLTYSDPEELHSESFNCCASSSYLRSSSARIASHHRLLSHIIMNSRSRRHAATRATNFMQLVRKQSVL